MSTLGTPSAQAVTSKPSAPAITAVTFSKAKKGKVTITVSISLPINNGGSKILASKVTASGKSCTMKGTKTSCKIKNVKQGRSILIKASSKNMNGYGKKSESIRLVVGKSQYVQPTPSPTTISTPTPLPTPIPMANCATGAICSLGDIGPGGGIVFFVDDSGFNCGPLHTSTGSPSGVRCKYLEFAPSGWSGGLDSEGVNSAPWSSSAHWNSDVLEIDNRSFRGLLNSEDELGLGYKNSIAIVSQSGVNASYNKYAAGVARSYKGGFKEDWFLPTSTELNLLCQWVRGVTPSVETLCTGGFLNYRTEPNARFTGGNYASSTESMENFAWAMNFDTVSYEQFGKNGGGIVRPVRAF